MTYTDLYEVVRNTSSSESLKKHLFYTLSLSDQGLHDSLPALADDQPLTPPIIVPFRTSGTL